MTAGRLAGALLVAAALLGSAPLAAAQDAPGTTVTLDELGRGPVALPTATATRLTLPVPDGLTATELTGTVALPLAATGAVLAVTAGDAVLARLDVTAAGDTGSAPVTVPLRDAPVVDRALTLTVRAEVRTGTDTCQVTPDAPPTLTGAAVTYTGTEAAPASPATFLPPVLRTATVYLTDPASPAQRDTALALSTGVVHRYGTARTQVRLAELAPGAPAPTAGPLERALVLRTGTTPGVALERTAGGTALALTGDDATLRDQARLLLTTPAAGAAVTDAVPRLPTDVLTLGDLAQSPLLASGRQHVELPVTVDQTRLGRPLGTLQLHLLGGYTPQPTGYGGQLTATVGDTRLAATPLDGSGRLDLTVDVPAERLGRTVALTLAVDLSGDFGCGTGSATTLSLDPDSTVTTTAGAPGPVTGFAALPQALAPGVTVGLDSAASTDATADLGRAQQLLVAWQRLSAAPLDPTLTGVADALGAAGPALLVTPAGGPPEGTTPPLAEVDAAALAVRGLPDGAPRGSLQTWWDGSRTVVAAGSTGDPADLDAVLAWLAAEPTRVADLDGDVVVGSAAVPPVQLAVRVAAPGPTPGVVVTGGGLRTPLVAVGGAAVLLLGGALLLTVLWRRRRP